MYLMPILKPQRMQMSCKCKNFDIQECGCLKSDIVCGSLQFDWIFSLYILSSSVTVLELCFVHVL